MALTPTRAPAQLSKANGPAIAAAYWFRVLPELALAAAHSSKAHGLAPRAAHLSRVLPGPALVAAH
jgi:hypothetical protein